MWATSVGWCHGGFHDGNVGAGHAAHSWQAVAAGGMSIGHKGMGLATRLLAKSAAQLILQPEVIAAAKAELLESQGGFRLRGAARRPRATLDYRK